MILPLLLAVTGIVVDFGRVYGIQVALESATRNAAEYVAGFSTTSTAAADARRVVCVEMADVTGYVAGADAANCTQPTVTIVSFSRSSTAPGATAAYPRGSVQLRVTMPFAMLMKYPWLDGGVWTLSSDVSYEVMQGR